MEDAPTAGLVSDGEGDGELDGRVDGEADGERVGVGETGGLADGVDVGPSAIAGVARYDAAKATARSGGARKRWTFKTREKTAGQTSESGHKSPQRAGEAQVQGAFTVYCGPWRGRR